MDTVNVKEDKVKDAGIRSYLDWALKGRSAWWLYIIGAILLYLILTVGMGIVGVAIKLIAQPLIESSAAVKLLSVQLPFLLLWISPPLIAVLLHKHPWWSVVMPRLKVVWRNLGIGILFGLLWILINTLINTQLYGIKFNIELLDPQVYLPFLAVALIGFLIQTSAEELMFRGYYMQVVRRFTASPIFIIGLSGIAFGLAHAPNAAGFGWPWYGVFVYIIDGCLLGWLAYRTRSLWLSIGWHWVNNFALIALVSVKNGHDAVQGLSIFTVDAMPSVEFVLLNKLIVYPLLALAIHWWITRREKASAE